MATKTYFINSDVARYADNEFAWMQTLMLGEGIIASSAGVMGLAVSELAGTPGMAVSVEAGKALVEITKDGRTLKVVVENDASLNTLIAANASGSNRVDAIIVRVDVDVEPNSLKSNVATIETITGTGVSALSDGAITAAVGNDGWYRLANVTVANGAVSILNASIASTRSKVLFTDAIGFGSIFPVGSTIAFAGASAPAGWLACDGSAVSRTGYADLYAAIGTTYGAGDGSTTFNLPDTRSSMIIGSGQKVRTTTFNGASDVDPTTDIITVPSNDWLHTGQLISLSGSSLPAITRTAESYTGIDSDNTIRNMRIGFAQNGDAVYIVTVNSGSGNIDVGSTYYVVNYDNATGFFQLSTTPGGSPMEFNVWDEGSGSMRNISSPNHYVIRVSATSIKLASSLANAQNGTASDITADGSGTVTITQTLSNRVLGATGGEEAHAMSITELLAHTHAKGSTGTNNDGSSGSIGDGDTSSRGGNAAMNVMNPYLVMRHIIKT